MYPVRSLPSLREVSFFRCLDNEEETMESLYFTLPILCKGMGGIFLVIGMIVFFTWLLNRFGGSNP